MSIPVRIYCPSAGVRHNFVFKLLFIELLGISYTVCDSTVDCHINYSDEKSTSPSCVPHGLLSEHNIKKVATDIEPWEDTHCFFRTDGDLLPFDIFAASFYLVARYEEYLPYQADDHNRFPASASLLVRHKLIQEPLVNIWALKLKSIVYSAFPNLHFAPRKFEYLSTIDIDQAWKFKYKGALRSVLGTFRDLKEGKWENLKERWPVLLGLKKDPFRQAFDWHYDREQRYALEPIYFILIGDYGQYDKNTDYKNRRFQQLIKSLDHDEMLGIHPSYQSNFDDDTVKIEVDRLRASLNRQITRSRQHFLMHTMPETYRTLLASGITEDHTMGYSTHLGFRAGIAAPFYWFDLEKNETTDLKLIPFCAMDITPLYYRGESPNEAINTLEQLLLKVNNVGGLFVSLWHNESFSETERWKGWSRVYDAMLKKVYELESQTNS